MIAPRSALKASPSKQRVAGFQPVSAASKHDGAVNDDVYENAPCGFHSLDADDLFIRINNTLLRWLGYRREDVVGKINFRDILTETSRELFDANFRNAGAPGFIADETYEMRRKDGSILNVLLHTVTVRNADGRIVMTRSATLNIEAGKQSRRKVMELLDLNTKIIARAPVGIIVYDASGECILANPGSAAIVGGTPEDIMLHPFTELRFWRETGLLQAAKEALATGTTRNENVHVATAEGRDLWLDCDLVPFTTDGASRLLYIMTDVTDRRLAEIELGEATRVAELASQVKSEFLANMSHEIRTPMTAIMGFTSLLEEAPLESRERDYVAKIKMSAASLLGILNDVLDFSKIEAGRLELEHTPFSLQDVMRSIAVIVGANAAFKNLEVVYDMAADVPDRLTGDPLRLQQILLNLAGNAVKFTSVGEVVLAVRKVRNHSAQMGPPPAGQAQVELEFLIRDTGVGIEPEARNRLFQAFSQADASTTRKFGGTGLGLAISSKLAALMGGAITVSSILGRGSEFRFIASFGEAPEMVEDPLQVFDGLEGLEVLVVDDNDTARQILVRTCESFGWRVSVAASGAEGLDALRRASALPRPLDVLLLDWRMPEMDGLEMLRLAKDDPAVKTPPVVLMVSISDTGEVRRQVGGIRIDRILAKPATPSTVFDAVAQLRSGGTAPPRRLKPPGMSGRLRGVRLLLVEDNEINQQVALAILRRADADVAAVNNGEAAVNLLRENPAKFDAVLMDVQMPGMNGYETTRIIRAIPGLDTLPIIAMTANVMTADHENARQAGMSDHLAKPIDVEDMFAVLHRWVPTAHSAAPIGKPTDGGLSGLPDKLPGIDIRQGLSRAVDQPNLYRRLLIDMAAKHTGEAERIASLLASGNLKEAQELIHALKGSAGNLGVNRVAEAASALEGAIRLKASDRYERLIGDLAVRLRQAAASIRKLGALCVNKQTDEAKAGDRQAAVGVIQTLTEELKHNDTNALLTMDRLFPLTGSQAAALEPLEAAVQALDFEQALIELERLAPKLGFQP